MTFKLTKRELTRYVDSQVKAGVFPSAQAVIEEALARMMTEKPVVLTAEDLRAIKQADAEIERGEFIEFDEFATAMRRKYRV